MRRILIGLLLCFSTAAQAEAQEGSAAEALIGTKTVQLTDGKSEGTTIGTISFSPTDDGVEYLLSLKEEAFGDYFLSMRPFKCVAGPEKHWCHVPYPYENRRTLIGNDLTDLEYDLLFIWKGATDYGINMWNGVYYKLKQEKGRFIGRLHEVDMDRLAVPPSEGELRPLKAKHLEEGDPDSHWFPMIIIQ
ncbi:conserved hypothetical protein [Roseibium sp. TrichSKD4]|uniref:hypothetical protein n=1 Tax=Roseibium sp. TrichSKD4 TaxID=744980 RepID=UPI0001E575C1|nr:hypothetical protein [Roseibium sp. TrichSKD4]EFO29404.1 conserved hypothetical protein [Roseibium sp. TrichSKD4]